MSLILTFLLSFNTVWAAEPEWAQTANPIPVYAQAKAGAKVLGLTVAGEKIAVRQRGKTYSRVQFKRAGKWKAGYVLNEDLASPGRAAPEPRGSWGFGGGGMYSYLRHSAKSFETEDQVRYTTADFTSASFSPFVMIQYERENFYRLILAYRLTDYSSSATTDVGNFGSRNLSLQHTMLSGTVQKMWTPFKTPLFYFGLGAEVSRASKADLVLGNLKLPVNTQDLPTYFGGHVAAGGQFDVWRGLSGFAELRVMGFFNQSPMIFGTEAALGLLYWP